MIISKNTLSTIGKAEVFKSKICSKCGIEKKLSEYHIKKSGVYGRLEKCKECRKEQSKKDYSKNKEKVKEYHKQYWKKNKEVVREKNKKYREENKKELSKKKKEYYIKNKEAKRTYDKQYWEKNKERLKEHCKQYWEENKEKLREYNRLYSKKYIKTEKGKEMKKRQAHKRRARIAQVKNLGTYTPQEWQECLKFFDYCDAYTGEPLGEDITIDHITPISKGGANTIDNLVPCKSAINSSKHNSLLNEWYIKQPFYNIDRHNKIKEWIILQIMRG